MWVVGQLGSRDHYLYPRALAELGLLTTFVTDIHYSRTPHSLMGRLERFSAFTRRITSRQIVLPPSAEIQAYSYRGLFDLAVLNASLRVSKKLGHTVHRRNSRRVAVTAAKKIREKSATGPVSYLGYCGGSLEAMTAAKKSGGQAVVVQFDGGWLSDELYRREFAQFPEWAAAAYRRPDAWRRRVLQEWAVADKVIVNSSWVKQFVESEGVPAHKVHILPLAFEHSPAGQDEVRRPDDSFRFLWVGGVSIGKGFHHAATAFKRLLDQGVKCELRVIGAVSIPPAKREALRGYLTLEGPKPKAEVMAAYRSSDVFLFPTVADGFGLTQLEALSQGLPVIASTRCGEVVQNGISGWCLDPLNTDSLTAAMLTAATHRPLVEAMRPACHQRAREFSLANFTKQLATILESSS
jgi:hypothetical protein